MQRKRTISRQASLNVAEVPSDAQTFVFDWRRQAAVALVQNASHEETTEVARGFCTAAVKAYWHSCCAAKVCSWTIREPVTPSAKEFHSLAAEIGRRAAKLPLDQAGYALGQLYTSLLPEELRKRLGAYYTPPPLVNRLVFLASEYGIDWERARIIDPACGGAAFLAPVARRMLETSQDLSAGGVLEQIESRVVGIEVDPFAAWMSAVLLDVALLELCLAAGRRARVQVMVRDSLAAIPEELGKFDLVIGNPPYGKLSLPSELRSSYRRSLFGHANLYGLFTDLALRLVRPRGIIAYVTPTSFLGGEYFKQLRSLLSSCAPPVHVDFVRDRDGVFDGVLQETMLAIFREGRRSSNQIPVNVLNPTSSSFVIRAEAIGTVRLNGKSGSPWFLPRDRAQADLIGALDKMPHRLADYHFSVSTGQLVWNRHKKQLRQTCEPNCYPIIWAEAIAANGVFTFRAAKRDHLPFLKIGKEQNFLINHEPCVLVQRTTSKEQKRRLVAAVVPNFFVLEFPGFIVENHLNMILSSTAKPAISLTTLTALLNSHAVDRAFRCISGSVAVSAYELRSLPLPNPEQMKRLQELVLSGVSKDRVDLEIERFYFANHA